ncbi:hypothetical protein V8E55_011737, partial [Tylopilus felleus]
QWNLKGHNGPINTLSVLEEGTYLASRVESSELSRKRTFEWIHMETVFNDAIEHVEIDDTQGLLAITGKGRIAIYMAKIEGEGQLHLIHMCPPLSEHRLPALPITAHFYEQGRSLMVGFLDARELGNTAYHEATGTLLIWNLMDGINVYCLSTQPSVTFTFSRRIKVNFRRTCISHIGLDVGGQVGICRSDTGEVYIWEITTGSLRQVLPHGTDLQIVQALACHSFRHAKVYIASGDSGPDDKNPSIVIWSPVRFHCTLVVFQTHRCKRLEGRKQQIDCE